MFPFVAFVELLGTGSLNGSGQANFSTSSLSAGSHQITASYGGDANFNASTSSPLTQLVNDPVANNDSYSVVHDHTLTVAATGVLGNDLGPNLTAVQVSGPSHGTLTLNSDGSFVYVPNTSYVGNDTFTYKDFNGASYSNVATVIVNVTNQAPVPQNDSYTVSHDQFLILNAPGVLANDGDADGDPLTAALVSGPTNGILWYLASPGNFIYIPNSSFVGSDSFTYQASDGIANSPSATVSISVTNVAPVASNDTYGVQPGTSLNLLSGAVLANDIDTDGDPLTSVLVSGPTNGSLTLNSDGSLTYTPNQGFTGTDAFTYQANDGIANSNTATATLNVHQNNQPPLANNDSYSTRHNTPLTVVAAGLLQNDSDADFDPRTASLVSGPSNGTLTLNPDGSLTYTPNTNFVGSDSFSYVANDGLANSSPATVTITVTDNPPSAGDNSYTVAHDQTLTVAGPGVLGNDADVDGDPITAVLVTAPTNGTLSLNSDGSLSYTPDSHFAGTDCFTYAANDGMTNSAPATVFIFVLNTAPAAAADYYATPAGQSLTVAAGQGVVGNDIDPDGDPITVVLVNGPANGTLTFNSDGSLTYTPNSGFIGNDAFTYGASDGILNSNPATVTVTVVGNVPVANDGEFAVAMNQTLTISAPGVLWNDAAPTGQSLTAVLATGPAHGIMSLSSDGSFTYTPNTGFTGEDSFTYRPSAGGVQGAPANVVVGAVNVQMQMPQGPWVPINANDDNGSNWAVTGLNNTFTLAPGNRDFEVAGAYRNADPQLMPLNLTITAPPTGFVSISGAYNRPDGTGKVYLWSDQRKTRQITPGLYPDARRNPACSGS